MRSLLVAFALAAALAPSPVRAQTCAPTTALERQFRTRMKHRAPGPAGAPVSVAAMLAWPTPRGVASFATRAQESPVDARESRAFTVEGDLWRVKVEDNDCDLHLELVAPGAAADAPRVIAEVPTGPGYDAARAAILAAVRLPTARGGDRIDLATPVRVRLTGYAFWDGAHWCRSNAARGCGHGTPQVATLWELHPVWRVEVLSAGAAPSAPPLAPSAPPAPSTAPSTPSSALVVCNDGWTSPCPCGHPPHMHCCRGRRGESSSCESAPRAPSRAR